MTIAQLFSPFRRAIFFILFLALTPVLYAGDGLQTQSADGQNPGKVIFQNHCAQCHDNKISGAPPTFVLRIFRGATIHDILTTGRMRAQAAMLSDLERRQVAEYLSGKPLKDLSSRPLNMCAAGPNWFDKSKTPVGVGWGITEENTRFIPPEQAGITAADVKYLKLKWAFAFPDASSATAQPLVAGSGLFVGSQNGTVYALDAQSGCVHWTFNAAAEIPGAIVIRENTIGSPTLFFSDRLAFVYAVDAVTGTLLWRTRADEHPSATTMGTPVLVNDRLLIPVLSFEENAGGPEYSCCTFRGALLALEALTGSTVWKRYTIPSPATEQFKNTLGVPQYAPSGAGVWRSPTIDRKRRLIYFTTGNSYSEPADENSDAVFALDLESGEVKWRTQTFANDSWLGWDHMCRLDPVKKTMPGCPLLNRPGPDIDFTTAPVLVHGKHGKDILVAGRKDGTTFGIEPYTGKVLWASRTSQNPDFNAGALNWGLMAEGRKIILPSVGTDAPNGAAVIPSVDDGLFALDAFTGKRIWANKVTQDCEKTTPCTGLSFAPIGTERVVFAGATDGYVRAYDTKSGKVLWRFDTARKFESLNGDEAFGGAVGRNSIMIAHGMVYVGSGYGRIPGNVLLAFSAVRD